MPTILFGTEPNPMRAGGGEFFCPTCMARRPYQRTEVRRRLRVLAVLRLPAGRLGEYVECGVCLSTFRPEVLAYDAGERTPAVMAEYQRAMKRILALMVAADGVIQPPEIQMVRRVFEDLSGIPLGRQEVLDEVAEVGSSPTSAARYLARVVGYLNDYGKEQVLRAAARVSHADGQLHAREAAVVRRLGGVLHLPPARIDAILAG